LQNKSKNSNEEETTKMRTTTTIGEIATVAMTAIETAASMRKTTIQREKNEIEIVGETVGTAVDTEKAIDFMSVVMIGGRGDGIKMTMTSMAIA
jgi:D-arabinose 1-dehydrogenase-like Zn-dependent alcohol dehydrogenase